MFKTAVENDTPIAELSVEIDAILPQTQCGQCGYAACKPYAVAIAEGGADINQCPPGGDAGVRALADLLHVRYKPLNPAHGEPKSKTVALIDEKICIGCTLCIQACPVDAILGAAKLMHSVIASECTGCELCVAPCPVDCISLLPLPKIPQANSEMDNNVTKHAANIARQRHAFRLIRIEREHQRQTANASNGVQNTNDSIGISNDVASIANTRKTAGQAAMAAAIKRANAQKLSTAGITKFANGKTS